MVAVEYDCWDVWDWYDAYDACDMTEVCRDLASGYDVDVCRVASWLLPVPRGLDGGSPAPPRESGRLEACRGASALPTRLGGLQLALDEHPKLDEQTWLENKRNTHRVTPGERLDIVARKPASAIVDLTIPPAGWIAMDDADVLSSSKGEVDETGRPSTPHHAPIKVDKGNNRTRLPVVPRRRCATW